MEMELLSMILEQSAGALLVLLLVSIAFGVLCGVIAARRGASWVFWSVMGFAFGPFAVPFVFLSKKSQDQPPRDR